MPVNIIAANLIVWNNGSTWYHCYTIVALNSLYLYFFSIIFARVVTWYVFPIRACSWTGQRLRGTFMFHHLTEWKIHGDICGKAPSAIIFPAWEVALAGGSNCFHLQIVVPATSRQIVDSQNGRFHEMVQFMHPASSNGHGNTCSTRRVAAPMLCAGMEVLNTESDKRTEA